MVANPNPYAGQENPIIPDVDTFKLVAETHKQVAAVAATARDAIKTHYTSPDSLANFIQRHQTPVYVFQGKLLHSFCLWLLGFEPGFIPPRAGLRYRLLQRFLGMQSRFSQKETQGQTTGFHFDHGVFVLTQPLFTVGFISHQLHHWLAYRSGMKGYSDRSQQLYRDFWGKNQGRIGQEVYKMKAEDMRALKAAINRDLEALQFLKEIADEILIPARQARRIPHGKASA